MVEPREDEEAKARHVSEDAQDPGVLMEEVVETLKLLNYEKLFLSEKGFQPLSRAHFALPGGNPSEQFIYFTSLVSWLFQMNGSRASFNKYDDPSTVANNITVEMRKLGVDLDFPPGKLRAGHGEGPCLVLLALSKKALEAQKFRYKTPKFPDEGGDLEGEVIEGDEEAEIMDEVIESEDDNDLTPFGDIASSKPAKAADDDAMDSPNVPIWSNIDPDEWRLEVERVSNRLKLQGDPTGGDHREWRSHLEQTKSFKANIEKLLPEGELRLRKIADDLSKSLERISSQEKKIHQSMGEITGNYRAQANDLNSRKTLYKQLNEKVANLSNQLSEINSRLEEIQDKIDQQGRMVTDTSPLMGIKESLRVLKLESKDMELRGAVLSHSLFQAKLKEKSRGDI